MEQQQQNYIAELSQWNRDHTVSGGSGWDLNTYLRAYTPFAY